MPSDSSSPRPLVSAIIVNWNTKHHLILCLKALTESGYDERIEIIVVDNNSPDGSAAMVREKFPKVNLVANDSNRMFAGGVNSGLAVARGKHYLILNPDLEISADTILKLAAYLENNPDVAATSPQLRYPDGSVQTEYFLQLPTLPQLILFYTALWKLGKSSAYLRNRYYEQPVNSTGITTVPQLPGACILVRGSVVQKIGGMDEDFTLYFEDVDWCKRIGAYGQLVVNTDVTVMHHGSGSYEKKAFWIYGRFRMSMLLYFKKHIGTPQFHIGKWVFFALTYWGYMVRSIQKVLPFGDKSRLEYHFKKYNFFFQEYRERKHQFAKH